MDALHAPRLTGACTHPTTRSRNVPLEYCDPGGTWVRIPNAPFHTCTQCGASFYPENIFNGVRTSIEPPRDNPPDTVYE